MPERTFSSAAINELQYYVYLYINPLTNRIFYVGKGQGNRVFEHLPDQSETDKVRTIAEIRAKGLEPKIDILIHRLPDEETAFRIESAVIDALGLHNLSNKVRGQGGNDYGRADVDALIARLNNPRTSERREGGSRFERVLESYTAIAPINFSTIGKREDNRRSDTWAAINPAHWPSEWNKVKYQFDIHKEYGDQIGAELRDERGLRKPDQVTRLIEGFEAEFAQLFPGRAKWIWKFKYGGCGLVILFDRDWPETEIAQAMRTLIERTHIRVEKALREALPV